MTTEEKQKIRKVIAVLQKIDNGVNVFFNITQYEKLGLITTKKKWGFDAVGNKVVIGHTFHLTEIAKKYINIIL